MLEPLSGPVPLRSPTAPTVPTVPTVIDAAADADADVAAASGTRRRIGFASLLATTTLLVWFALRIALFWVGAGGGAEWPQALGAFVVGLWFDLATLTFLLAPWLLLGALLPDRWRGSRGAHGVRWVVLGIALAVLLFDALAEIVFWQEFATRFNFIAVDYLIYTQEVIGNIWQSYPVPWMLAGIAVVSIALLVVLRRAVQFASAPRGPRQRAIRLGVALLAPLLAWQTVSVEQMTVTGNAYTDELAGNGLFSLAAALRSNELDYDRFYRTIEPRRADRILVALGVGAPASVPLPSTLPRAKNVVLISVESLSAEYLGSYGDHRGLTPNLDRLAAAGVKFERMFATGTRTVRGLEALSLGTPPIPGQAIVRRPGNAHLNTLGEVLHDAGFAALFVYGGYGYFDNMNAYFAANQYRVLDRTGFDPKTVTFGNIWGVADEILFTNARREIDATARSGQRFFAHIMTTSNHRPYTYPAGRIDIPSPGGRAGAVKYTDWAIGRFIEQAQHAPWFQDTLFVIIADHCASVSGKTRIPVERYHIPMIFYGPGIVIPGVYAPLLSQIDVPPTLLDVLGIAGRERFYGTSIYAAANHVPRAFLSTYQELGYYKQDTLTVLSPNRRVAAYHIDPRTYAATPTAPNGALLDEATAYYQHAAQAFRSGALRHRPVSHD